MSRMATIFKVVQQDTDARVYFYPSKAKAMKALSDFVDENREQGYGHASLHTIQVALNREAIADELNRIIADNKLNEH